MDTRHNLKPEELEALEAPIKFDSTLTTQLDDVMGTDSSIVDAMLVSTQGISHVGVRGAPRSEEFLKSIKPRLNYMMKHRHGSPFEQAALKFYVRAPIMVFREWHRHRIGFSYNEVSARYKIMPPEFYIPPHDRPLVQEGKHSAAEYVAGSIEQYARATNLMKSSYETAWKTYVALVKQGIAKEIARSVLPVGLYTEMIVTLNPRSAMAFLSLRQKHDPSDALFVSRPQWEINQCANMLEEDFQACFPITHSVYVENKRVAP